jgi:hypothetical protein
MFHFLCIKLGGYLVVFSQAKDNWVVAQYCTMPMLKKEKEKNEMKRRNKNMFVFFPIELSSCSMLFSQIKF